MPLLAYIHQVLEQSPPPADVPLLIKFVFNGATMTAGSCVQEEIGAFQPVLTCDLKVQS